MLTSSRTRRILIIVSSMAIGGPQKSLIGLLERIDTKSLAVDLMLLNGLPGALSPSLPPHVRVLHTPPEVAAATLPRNDFARSLRVLLFAVRLRTLPALMWELVKGVLRRDGWQTVRQRVWRAVRADLPRLPEHYEAAFGILGLSTYAVVDLVDAEFKYHWIRSDTRMLQRDEEIDAEYYRQLTGAVSVSAQCSDIFQEMYPSTHGRVVVYKNDIPLRLRSGGAEELPEFSRMASHMLLTVSRLDRLKGIDLAIRACAELVARGHRVCWVVAGEGPEREKLEQLVQRHDLAEFFLLPGSILDMGPYLEVADVYVHPSRAEGRSNAVEEARAQGLPIVATAYETVAGQVEDGVTGIVCEIDSGGIADAIERVLVDPGLRVRLGEAAKRAYASEVCDPNALMNCLSRGVLPTFVAGAD